MSLYSWCIQKKTKLRVVCAPKIIKALISAMALVFMPYSQSTMAGTPTKPPSRPATLSSLKSSETPSLVAADGTFWGLLEFSGSGSDQYYMLTVLGGTYVSIPVDLNMCGPDGATPEPSVACVTPTANNQFYYELPNCTGQAYIQATNFIFRYATGMGFRGDAISPTADLFYSTETTFRTYHYLSRDLKGFECFSEEGDLGSSKKITGKITIPYLYYVKRLP